MILGIDTSCYTTSAALYDDTSRLVCEQRRLLAVDQGSRGLRQSEALFAHIRQLPELLEALFAQAGSVQLSAVAVSARPRPQDDSYMPVFLAGVNAARAIAASQHIPCYLLSHQEGHLAAALASRGLSWREPFHALHLSGGTGELLAVQPKCGGFAIEQVGGTDLPPGQFVDRIGVALGLPFPAGPALEKLAAQAVSRAFRLSGSVRGTEISFSGPESAAMRAIDAGIDPAEIAAAVLDNIAKSLHKAITNLREQQGVRPLLISGGVAANLVVRAKLEPLGAVFGTIAASSDNACGIAALGAAKYAADR